MFGKARFMLLVYNFWGLEGKYIAAQICFLFARVPAAPLFLENDLTGSHN